MKVNSTQNYSSKQKSIPNVSFGIQTDPDNVLQILRGFKHNSVPLLIKKAEYIDRYAESKGRNGVIATFVQEVEGNTRYIKLVSESLSDKNDAPKVQITADWRMEVAAGYLKGLIDQLIKKI